MKPCLGCGDHRLRLWWFYWEQSDFLSEIEYDSNFQDKCSCGCQYTRMFASYTGYRRLLSKTNSPTELPCFLDIGGNIQRHVEWSECFTAWGKAWVSQQLEGTLCLGAMESNLKNLCCMPFKAARPSQLHGSLHPGFCFQSYITHFPRKLEIGNDL